MHARNSSLVYLAFWWAMKTEFYTINPRSQAFKEFYNTFIDFLTATNLLQRKKSLLLQNGLAYHNSE
jgi:hypothetical protein